MTWDAIKVSDDHLDDAYDVREAALTADYGSPVDHNGTAFPGVSIAQINESGSTIYRRYLPEDQPFPTLVHSDEALGRVTEIVSLFHTPGHSLRFWRPRVEMPDSHDLADWGLVAEIPLRFNRCVRFSAYSWHSRHPVEIPDGTTMENCRLLRVRFLPDYRNR